MIRTATAFTVLLWATAAAAQAPAPKARPAAVRATPVQESSAYCSSGAAAIFQTSGEPELAAVQQACKRGDIIAISTSSEGSSFAVGRLCDFSKPIVSAGDKVILCALTGTRGIR